MVTSAVEEDRAGQGTRGLWGGLCSHAGWSGKTSVRCLSRDLPGVGRSPTEVCRDGQERASLCDTGVRHS